MTQIIRHWSTPRTAEEMEKFRSLVMKAVEYDVERGDQIEVQNLPSDEDTKAAEAQLRCGIEGIPSILDANGYRSRDCTDSCFPCLQTNG